MKVAFAIILAAVSSCSPSAANPPPTAPTPRPPPIDYERDGEAKATSCANACKRMTELACSGWAPAGGTCAVGCASATEALGQSLSLTCVARAQTCDEALRCVR